MNKKETVTRSKWRHHKAFTRALPCLYTKDIDSENWRNKLGQLWVKPPPGLTYTMASSLWTSNQTPSIIRSTIYPHTVNIPNFTGVGDSYRLLNWFSQVKSLFGSMASPHLTSNEKSKLYMLEVRKRIDMTRDDAWNVTEFTKCCRMTG